MVGDDEDIEGTVEVQRLDSEEKVGDHGVDRLDGGSKFGA